MAVMGN